MLIDAQVLLVDIGLTCLCHPQVVGSHFCTVAARRPVTLENGGLVTVSLVSIWGHRRYGCIVKSAIVKLGSLEHTPLVCNDREHFLAINAYFALKHVGCVEVDPILTRQHNVVVFELVFHQIGH